MKKYITKAFLLLAIGSLAISACKDSDKELDLQTAKSQNGAIDVVTVQSVAGSTSTSTDSVYALNAIVAGTKLTSITASNLLAATNTYLTTNYTGYTFIKAFSVSPTTAATVNGYIVAINFNSKPVVLKFTAAGAFNGVLELREGNDLKNKRTHSIGGLFENRNTTKNDSLGLTSLSSAIKTYMTSTASGDTLKAAWTNRDGSVILLSKNVSFFTNTFTSAGAIISRNSLSSRSGADTQVLSGALPPAILTYLTLNYPQYLIRKAYYTEQKGAILGYVVVIDANLTKYAFVFTSTGGLTSTRVIR